MVLEAKVGQAQRACPCGAPRSSGIISRTLVTSRGGQNAVAPEIEQQSPILEPPTEVSARSELQPQRSALEIANGTSIDTPKKGQVVVAHIASRYYGGNQGAGLDYFYSRAEGEENPTTIPPADLRLISATHQVLDDRNFARSGIPAAAPELAFDEVGIFTNNVQAARIHDYRPGYVTVPDLSTSGEATPKVVEAQPGITYVTNGEQTDTVLALGVNGHWAPNRVIIRSDGRGDVFIFGTPGQFSYPDMLALAKGAYPKMFEKVEDAGFVFPDELGVRNAYSPDREENLEIEPAGFVTVSPKKAEKKVEASAGSNPELVEESFVSPEAAEPAHTTDEEDTVWEYAPVRGTLQEARRENFARRAVALGRLAVTKGFMGTMEGLQKVATWADDWMVRGSIEGSNRTRMLSYAVLGVGVVALAEGIDVLFGGDMMHHARTVSHTLHGSGLSHAVTPDQLPSAPTVPNSQGWADALDSHSHSLDGNTNLPHVSTGSTLPQAPNLGHKFPDGINPNIPHHTGGTASVAPHVSTGSVENLTYVSDTESAHVLTQLHKLGYHVGQGHDSISHAQFNRLVTDTLKNNGMSPVQARHMQVGSSFHLLPDATVRQIAEEFARQKVVS